MVEYRRNKDLNAFVEILVTDSINGGVSTVSNKKERTSTRRNDGVHSLVDNLVSDSIRGGVRSASLKEEKRATMSATSQTRLNQTQAQVDEVVQIMSQNADKAWERGAKLDDLDNRAAALEQGSSQFATTSRKVNRKYYWKDKKMLLLLIGAVALGLGLLVLFIYLIAK
ncbi:vesicle-associated membrane protein 2-like [Symsagittifera roscoffensis]|uniref:vesicle-associated membrane protein 2-like n=1 Tax=Symsagittifera roscoffensis TaxID=84072 RepID=UPI00307C8F28